MPDQVKLFCLNGQHSWMRDSKRGKRPLNCPEHQSSLVEKPEEKKKRTITPEHVRAIQEGRRRKAVEEAAEVTRGLQARLGRVREALVEAQARSEEKRAVISAQGGMRNCSDKAFNEYTAIVDRVASLLDAQRHTEKNLAGRSNGEVKE